VIAEARRPLAPAAHGRAADLAARALYSLLHFLALPTLVFWFRLRAYGRENVPRRGGAIVASSHQSYLDPVFFGAAIARPIDYFARRSLFRGLFGAFIRALDAVPIDRGARDLGALRAAIERLRAGRVLLLFPEGTRTETGALGPLEPGVAALARRAGVPIVPAAVAGAFEAWPRGRRFFRPGAPCAVALGRPLAPDDPRLLERLRDEILALQAFLERRRDRARPGR
jgi:1-acyl-sn-glycerol-3-phosphate acyltransferase